jgi:hypothetical protein
MPSHWDFAMRSEITQAKISLIFRWQDKHSLYQVQLPSQPLHCVAVKPSGISKYSRRITTERAMGKGIYYQKLLIVAAHQLNLELGPAIALHHI